MLWSPGIKAPGDSPASAVGGLQPGLRRLEANLCGKAQKWSVGCLLDGKQPLGLVCGAREGLQGEAGWEGWGPEHPVLGLRFFWSKRHPTGVGQQAGPWWGLRAGR